MSTHVETLKVRSGQGDYDVEFPPLVASVARGLSRIPKAVLVIDRKVAALHREGLAPVLSTLPVLELDATEDEKTLRGVEKVCAWLQTLGGTKQTTLITVGGGIIQDIACFAAHIYHRGIPWVYVPTTLLSMADSCIGAKCAINFNQFKNQLGFFYSPSKVLLCTDFTRTLADRDVASGYGEILKLMVISSEEKLSRLSAQVARGGLRGADLGGLIRESLEVKRGVIEVDEYEKDLRRILNYGHTFGHALESWTDHEIPHGLAVAWGMDLVNYLSWTRGLLSEIHFREIQTFTRAHLPFRLSRPIDAQGLIAGAKRDKKVADGQINLILLERPGKLKIVKTPFDIELEGAIQDYVTKENIFGPEPLNG